MNQQQRRPLSGSGLQRTLSQAMDGVPLKVPGRSSHGGQLEKGDAKEIPCSGCALVISDWLLTSWSLWLPGTALWAISAYIPLSGRLLDEEDAPGVASLKLSVCLALALVMGFGINLGLGFSLGPSWGTSLGVVTALYALFWGVIAQD